MPENSPPCRHAVHHIPVSEGIGNPDLGQGESGNGELADTKNSQSKLRDGHHWGKTRLAPDIAKPAHGYLRGVAKIDSFIHSELYSSKTSSGEFMTDDIVVTALNARTNFGKLLRRVETEGRSLVIEKRGTPRAVLLSLRDYVRLAVPEPEVLRIIGQESRQKHRDRLSSRQIDRIIKAARTTKRR